MPRWFNTADACTPADHYMVPTQHRLPGVRRFIEERRAFTVRAPPRMGKTTSFLSLAAELTSEARCVALLASMAVGADRRSDVDAAELALVRSLQRSARAQLPPALWPPPLPDAPRGRRLHAALDAWSQAAPLPVVIFLDDVDALQQSPLLPVLLEFQQRDPDRPGLAGCLLIFLGISAPSHPAARLVALPDFTFEQVAALYQQHTDETGQPFERTAVEQVIALTQGQPWLVNALAKVIVEELVLDRVRPIAPEHVTRAAERLITRRGTLMDRLSDSVEAPEIRAILEPMLTGATSEALPEGGLRRVADLGLIRREPGEAVALANPIYREVIARALALASRASLPPTPPTWCEADGALNLELLLDGFLTFWRRHSESLLASVPYQESAPHLLVTAFLDRVASGEGTLERAYGIGWGRMELCLRCGPAVLGVVLKVWRERGADPLTGGLEQIDRLLRRSRTTTGWLMIFDRRVNIPTLEERLSTEVRATPGGLAVVVIHA